MLQGARGPPKSSPPGRVALATEILYAAQNHDAACAETASKTMRAMLANGSPVLSSSRTDCPPPAANETSPSSSRPSAPGCRRECRAFRSMWSSTREMSCRWRRSTRFSPTPASPTPPVRRWNRTRITRSRSSPATRAESRMPHGLAPPAGPVVRRAAAADRVRGLSHAVSLDAGAGRSCWTEARSWVPRSDSTAPRFQTKSSPPWAQTTKSPCGSPSSRPSLLGGRICTPLPTQIAESHRRYADLAHVDRP